MRKEELSNQLIDVLKNAESYSGKLGKDDLISAVSSSLGKMKESTALPFLIERLLEHSPNRGVREALVEIGAHAVPPLIDIVAGKIKSTHPVLLRNVIEILDAIGDVRAIESLLEVAKNKSKERDVREHAIRASGNIAQKAF